MAQRRDITFVSGGQVCAGWLYVPDGGPAPVIVMAHGLGAVRHMRLDAYAARFVAAGYACLVFDYRHFGDSSGVPRQLADIAKQLADWSAAVAFARDLYHGDSRIVLWGTSFGGGHALTTAAREPRIAAVIAHCPFTDGIASALVGNPVGAVAVAAKATIDKVGAQFGRAPVMVPIAGRPGTVSLLSGADCTGFLELAESGAPFRNEVAARVALDILRYRPGKSAAEIHAPILFTVCRPDAVTPPWATLRYARTAPRGEVRAYRAGHFGIHTGPTFDAAVADQIEFLDRHVPARR